jgi:hypothetical protein
VLVDLLWPVIEFAVEATTFVLGAPIALAIALVGALLYWGKRKDDK